MQFSLQSLLLSFVVVWCALAAWGPWGMLIAVGLLGIAAYYRSGEAVWTAPKHKRWLLLGYLFWAVSCTGWVLVSDEFNRNAGEESVRRHACANNLGLLAHTLLLYHKSHHCFPPACIADADGKPMHSWRTLVAFLCSSVNEQYDFHEPWNSLNNRKAAANPAFDPQYRVCPDDPRLSTPGSTLTSYFSVVGPRTLWPADEVATLSDFEIITKGARQAYVRPLSSQKWPKISDLPDGGRHTIILVEKANAGIDWTEPRDLTVDEAIQAIRTGAHVERNGYYRQDQIGTHVAFADGSVHFLPSDTPTQTLEALLTINDGKTRADMNINRIAVFPAPPLHWAHVASLVVLAGSYALLLFRPVRHRNPPADSQ